MRKVGKWLLLVVLVTALALAGCGAGQRWTCQQAIDAFQAADLEAENAKAMTKEDYGMAPMLTEEGMRFLIPSLCDDCGGRVMSFTKGADLERTKAYYDDLGKQSAMFFSWTFARGNILVQINGDLPEEQARKYEDALSDLP